MLLGFKQVRTCPLVCECSSMLTAFLWLKVLIKTIGMYRNCQGLWYHETGRLDTGIYLANI